MVNGIVETISIHIVSKDFRTFVKFTIINIRFRANPPSDFGRIIA